MNKRGDTTVWHEIIKAIPAMILVLLLVAAGVKMWNVFHQDKDTTEKKDLERIVSEIKDLKQNDKVTVPIFSTGKYTIRAANTADSNTKQAFVGCNLDYCVCLFKDNSLFLCETFNLREEFGLKKEEFKTVTLTSDGRIHSSAITLTRVGTTVSLS